VGNAPTGFPPLPAPIPYDRTGATDGAAGVIFAWEKEQQLRSGLVTLRDHAFELPTNALEFQAHIQETVLAGAVTHWLHVAGNDGLENYDYPGGYAKRFDAGHQAELVADGARTVGIRMQEEALASLQIDGRGNAEKLTAGGSFTLKSHFDGNGGWVVTSIDHTARARKGTSTPATYSNGFTCIPAALPFRPSRTTPRPAISGVQTAVVVGPAGEEIYTDRYGRVKVQFFWDRQGKKDENSSCWIRVAHPTAQPGAPPALIPPIGSEVVVAFEEGDPDRPLIIGTVDNTQRPLP
jgi:type VI secretion system secreted protein VgrG